MKKLMKKTVCVFLTLCMMLSLAACAGDSKGTTAASTSEAAGDYYIDLTELGMKLTLYLRLDDAGNFLFSPTLDFDVNKSSGTFQKSDGLYIMVYDSVNGEEKSVSDGLTSSFEMMEDGSLDFSSCDCIYYGSATASAKSAEKADVKLIAHPVTADYEQPESDTQFQMGTYTAQVTGEDGKIYDHVVNFYEDQTYLHFMRYEEDGHWLFDYELGNYGVSTTQLALEPDAESAADSSMIKRTECEVVDGNHIKISIIAQMGAQERTMVDFEKTEAKEILIVLSGNDEFLVSMNLYIDGSYELTADGFTETGLLALDSEKDFVKQYPDHPETGVRGLSQVTTVPYGTLEEQGNKIVLNDLRVRTSDSFNRSVCRVIQQ